MRKKIKRKNDSYLKDAFILFGITLVAGLLLGLVYQTTLKPIQKAKDDEKKASYQWVMSSAKDFEDTDFAKTSQDFFTQNQISGVEIKEIMTAKDEKGEKIGYAVSVISKEGYGGDIYFSLGVDMNNTITGLEVVQNSETAGLGAKCKEDAFKGQYKGIKDQVELTKQAKTKDNQIVAISGATITSRAVTNAVNGVLAFTKTIK